MSRDILRVFCKLHAPHHGISEPSTETGRQPTGLSEIAAVFLRFGFTAFGGPAAHVAMMEDELVRRRQWVTGDRFLDLLGVANLIPGPSSTEVALYLGYERCGWRGLFVSGACFIGPAAILTAVIAWAYVRFGSLPQTAALLHGVKPPVIAVVAQAIFALAPRAARNRSLRLLGLLAVLASGLGADPILVFLGAGAASIAISEVPWREPNEPRMLQAVPAFGVAGITGAAASLSLPSLFAVFFKMGAVVFGSGYVLLAYLRADLVERLRWLSESQLMDAIAVGQITPGPVFSTATFIGYLLRGAPGAVVATVAVFLPSFLLVACTGRHVSRLRSSRIAAAFLDGVNVAAIALMVVVAVQLGRAAFVDAPAVLLGALSVLLLVRYRVSSTWIVLGGAAVGLAGAWIR